MRIAIDATPLMKPHRTGVARYVKSLVRAQATLAAEDDRFVLCYRLSRFSRRAYRLPRPGRRYSSAWIQGPLHPRWIDVTHGPDGRLLGFSGARHVVTVHDVFSLLSTEYGPDHFRRKMAKRYRKVAERADRIICISSWTRNQFWNHHPDVSEERFVVIPAGVDERFEPKAARRVQVVRSRLAFEGPYFLFVGEISRRKNISRLLEAFEGIPPYGPRLVLAGRTSYGHEDIEEEVERRGLADRVVRTGYFPDEDLPALIASAECLVYPSLMEGFGLPVIEAQACGTPVICSDRGALAETSGGIRVAVDPEDPDSIRDGMERVLDDARLRTQLREKGIEWAAQYRWRRVAERTLDVYREVAL